MVGNIWESFTVTTSDHVATVDIDTGTRGTLFGPTLFRELPALFNQLRVDSSVRVIVVRSAGDHFTFGIDLAAMGETFGPVFDYGGTGEDRILFHERIRAVQDALGVLASCPKPVLAAIHGRCIGVGLDLAAAADLRFGSADALLSAREVKVGIVADLGTLQRLPPLIGQANTRELALTGDDVTAERAYQMGLLNSVLPDRTALYEHTAQVAKSIAANPPLAVQGVKTVLNEQVCDDIHRGLGYVAAWNAAMLPSKEAQQAISSILKPQR